MCGETIKLILNILKCICFLLKFRLFFHYNICITFSKTILDKILQNYPCIARETY